MSLAAEDTNLGTLASSQLFLDSLFLQTSQLDSVLIYKEKTVKTSQWINDKGIEITVSDNGPGIPEAIKDNISALFYYQTHRARYRSWLIA